jgi:glycosyltransferase involved in cell wall biosynthesis
MRVLMFSWEFPPHVVGGLGKHVTELVPELAGQLTASGPIEIDLVTPRYNGGVPVERVSESLTVHRVDVPPLDPQDNYNSVISSNHFLVDAAAKFGDATPYDLIHVHDWLVTKAGIMLKERWKAPLLTTIHATERGRHRGHTPGETSYQIDRMEWSSCFEAWRVIACSQFMSHELQDYFELPPAKVVVIPNGIAVPDESFCSEEELEDLRRQYAADGERLLLYVGRIVHEKGLHVLIRAMPRILADYPNTRLLVAGKNGSSLWPLAYELNVDSAITFLDFVSNRERDCLYRIADAAIFPSLYEPFGIVALEAMAANCNVIASSVGGLGEVVRHLHNGLTVLPDNPMSIVWAVNQLFSDPQAAARRRVAAISEIRSVYNWSRVAQQTAALYELVVAERRNTEW